MSLLKVEPQTPVPGAFITSCLHAKISFTDHLHVLSEYDMGQASRLSIQDAIKAVSSIGASCETDAAVSSKTFLS